MQVLSVVEALDHLVEGYLHVPLRKVLDPNNKNDFLVIVKQLGDATIGLTQAEEADAIRRALDELDVDWARLTDKQKDRVVNAARANIASTADRVWPEVHREFEASSKGIVIASKQSSKAKYGLRIGVDLTTPDQRALDHMAMTQSLFVRNEYGQRADIFSDRAKAIVDRGLREGWGRKQIGAELHSQLTDQQMRRSRAYWNMVAGTYANRSRVYGNLSSYAAARITTFTFVSVTDERTSQVCRFMHGKKFTVRQALSAYRASERLDDPEDIKYTQPWLQVGRGKDGTEFIYYRDSRGQQNRVADISRRGVDLDDTGEFKNGLTERQLAAAGIMTPPLHGNCRSTIEADVDDISVQVPNNYGVDEGPIELPALPPLPADTAPLVPVPEADDGTPAKWLRPDNAQRLLSAIQDVNGVEVRMQLRDGLQRVFPGAVSQDVAQLRFAGSGYAVKDDDMKALGADAAHYWDGLMSVTDEVHQNIQVLLAGDKTKADALRVLLHEELHGFSRATQSSYQSAAARILEEAGTELNARYATSRILGAIPREAASRAYDGYIEGLEVLVATNAGTSLDEARELIRAAHAKTMYDGGPPITDPREYVETWVGGLDVTPSARKAIFDQLWSLG